MAGTDTAICCSICVIIVATLLSTILVGVSIKDIDPHSAGILINTVTKKIEQGKVYLPGKYSAGVTSKFITYPTSYNWINYAVGGDSGIIQAKTSNPSNIYLEISILYRIREESLHDVYKKWPTQNFQRDFILFAKDAIQKVPENFTNNDFFTKREEISRAMSDRVN